MWGGARCWAVTSLPTNEMNNFSANQITLLCVSNQLSTLSVKMVDRKLDLPNLHIHVSTGRATHLVKGRRIASKQTLDYIPALASRNTLSSVTLILDSGVSAFGAQISELAVKIKVL